MTPRVLFDADRKTTRQCGGCTLCCKLLPVRELDKPASTRCQHQRFGKGCMVYNKAGMPLCCKLWSCRWLNEEDTAELHRPDRAGYVIDVMPDYVSIVNNESGETINVEVVQVWVDPHRPDAHRDPGLRAYLARRGEEGVAALIRFGSAEGFALWPPAMCADGEWHEHGGTHTLRGRGTGEEFVKDVAQGLASARKVILG